jgi:hypothetical protein
VHCSHDLIVHEVGEDYDDVDGGVEDLETRFEFGGVGSLGLRLSSWLVVAPSHSVAKGESWQS